MSLPHSDLDDVGPLAILIPLRSLHSGKLRLAEAVDAATRADLIQSMATAVVAAAHDVHVLIVHDDPDVADWAHAKGASAFRPSKSGLNRAVSEGRDHLRDQGFSRVIIAHADLPKARDLRVLDNGHPISIAPDRHGDGTNVLMVPTTVDFTFAYGPGSFASHMAIARELGFEPHIVHNPDLAWDVDHPNDLLSEPQDDQ
jgi:2-phospho-L-lactate guanylyltransferase